MSEPSAPAGGTGASPTRRPLAILGCTSSAGKSLIATAVCGSLHRRGLRVAPFKAQNMSNNARVVDGGEIGVAQWLQARAAGVEPDVRMNPVLLKPEADDRSQVVLLGQVSPAVTATPWRQRAPLVWPTMAESLDSLRAEYDVVVVEGAGSPAEINLPDLVNNRVVAHADAAAVLVADIDRGGAFAHLVGTWTLVPDATRQRLRGFVLNKFRGDAELLPPGPSMVVERTGMADLGVLPMLAHDLPDEEGATVRHVPSGQAPAVAICRFPYASNLDEFQLLAQVARVRFVEHPAEIADAELVILPGSKHVAADAAWLARTGLGAATAARARNGGRVLGICGGCQLLGLRIDDPDGVEGDGGSSGGSVAGLGLLDVVTRIETTKRVTATMVQIGELPRAWSALTGLRADGYEIRHGRTDEAGRRSSSGEVLWARGSVLGTSVHGLLENPDVVAAIVGRRPVPSLDTTIDTLADAVEEHLDIDMMLRWTELPTAHT